MYQENELKQLYERLKTQYPRYELEFYGDRLILSRLHSRVEINRDGTKLYVNGNLYDQFTDVDAADMDDLYERIELFLLELDHTGMVQGNETYITALKRGTQIGVRFWTLMSVCLAVVMIALTVTSNPWLFPLVFLLPAVSFVIMKQIRKRGFQRYWVCPSCAQPLPMGRKNNSSEMEYVPQCPYCGQVLEETPDFEPIQPKYSEPKKPLEPAHDLPAPGSKFPGILTGGITAAFALLLLPLIFISDGNEPLDMVGVGIGVVLLLLLLGFGLMLLFCGHTEPEEIQQPVVIVREQRRVTVFGMIIWALGFILTLMGILVAGTPPFEADITAVLAIPGVLLFLLGVWMILTGRNRSLFVFRDNSVWYISSRGRRRVFAPGQVDSVRLTVNRSIHLLNKDGKKLASIEINMRGVPRFIEWVENADLAVFLTPTMERQAVQEEQEAVVQWREEYRTHWHEHIKGIRVGMWMVMFLFAVGTIAPVPLLLFTGVNFRTVTAIAALAPIPFLVFCLVFAPVLLFGDHPRNATLEWNAMHIKIPMVSMMLIGLLYISQEHYLWNRWLLQEADEGWKWLVRILAVATVLTVLLILRTPKRMRLRAGLFMGIVGLFIAIGMHYYVNAALSGPARHYPAVIMDIHAKDPEVDEDNYKLTIVMDNGEKAEIIVSEKIYEMAANGEPLDICHRESPFGVILLDIHAPKVD